MLVPRSKCRESGDSLRRKSTGPALTDKCQLELIVDRSGKSKIRPEEVCRAPLIFTERTDGDKLCHAVDRMACPARDDFIRLTRFQVSCLLGLSFLEIQDISR